MADFDGFWAAKKDPCLLTTAGNKAAHSNMAQELLQKEAQAVRNRQVVASGKNLKNEHCERKFHVMRLFGLPQKTP